MLREIYSSPRTIYQRAPLFITAIPFLLSRAFLYSGANSVLLGGRYLVLLTLCIFVLVLFVTQGLCV
ncbi:hypothetical protein V8E55_002206 [Tylopilus felleus]